MHTIHACPACKPINLNQSLLDDIGLILPLIILVINKKFVRDNWKIKQQ